MHTSRRDWIRTVNEELLDGTKVTYILDLYHLLDYLCDAVKAIAPNRQRRQELVEHYQSMLRKGRVRQLIEELSPHRHDHEAVEACCRYFTNNVDRMKYDRYTAHGLQTGSGAVEGACKHVDATRMKKTGVRRSKMGADAVLAARCLIHDNEFVDYLDWRMAITVA